MNRKIRFVNLLMFIAISIFSLTACSSENKDVPARLMRVYGTIYDDGELIVNENSELTFLQYSDLSTIMMCGQINCDHTNNVTEDGLPCFAWGKHVLPFLYNEKLYWFDSAFETKEGKTVETSILYSSDPFGTSEKEICRIQGLTCDWISTNMLKNNVLLFFPHQTTYDENGAVTDNNINHFCALNIENGKFMDLGETENNKTKILGVYDNKFYFNSSVYDIKTGELSQNTLPCTSSAVRINDNYYAYNSGKNIEVISPKLNKPIVIQGDRIQADTIILGDYLFQSNDTEWYYYNLNDENPVRKDINYYNSLCAQVVAEYDDSYIISIYDDEEHTLTKEKAKKSDILGG